MDTQKLIFFDLDGTLLTGMEYSWQHVWCYFDVEKTVTSTLAKRYFSGDITYSQWVDLCVAILVERGVRRHDLQQAFADITITDGADEVIQELKQRGHRLFIVSGGLDVALDVVIPTLKTCFDGVFINRLLFNANGVLQSAKATSYDGEETMTIASDATHTGSRKAACLRDVSAKYSTSLRDCVFIGDSTNDIAASKIAGVSIAYDSKSDELSGTATYQLKAGSFRAILNWL